jgi:type I restriction enzyme R subunit
MTVFSRFSEMVVEDVALSVLESLGYSCAFGPEITGEGMLVERSGFGEVVLAARFRKALGRLNERASTEALDEAFRKATVPQSPSLVANNRFFHRMLVNNIEVEGRRQDGSAGPEIVKLVDFENPDENDWLAVNQFTVIEGQYNRRPDIVIFINGLPLVVVELKNAADENATIWDAFHQLQTYKQQIPSIFVHNAVLVISDGLEARIGTISADKERFMPWRTIEGETVAPASLTQLEVLLRGVFDKRRFLSLLRHFVVFEEDPNDGSVIKKMAGYHQFHAVNAALESTVRASHPSGDKRAGVVWHTQGSGKSLTMAFYAGRLVLHPEMENPTIVVITDRNDLDDQLFGTFARCYALLRQKPVQAESREKLRELLQVASGGVVFTTIQKFFPDDKGSAHPLLSGRRNIVVIADEAHRSQYDFIDGFARHMRDALPNASFIGFTGTPIERTDASTRAVFGDYISVYDIQRAVEDKATVPIYYESRLARLELKESERPLLDEEFEEATEGEELEHKERLKTRWAQLEAIVGTEKRIRLIAEDLVKHWDERLEVMDGKSMVVCMSRRICVELYQAIRRLRPGWHDEDDKTGVMKIVMTGSASDPLEWQQHIRNKLRREALAKSFKDSNNRFKIVIVRDMWLTGFDAPCLHTMYIDKPMRGHGLMQAIARVNRVFMDKPGGLVVDYLGLAHELKRALAVYTESGGTGKTAIDQEEAVAVMQEKYEVCCNYFHDFDRSLWASGTPTQKLSLLPSAQECVLAKAAVDPRPEEYKRGFLAAVTELSQAFALAVPHPESISIRDDVGFFQAVRAALAKKTTDKIRPAEEIDAAIRQIISRAVSSEEVVDIFASAGLKKPDISILSDEFLTEVRDLPHRNLAVELLRKLLSDEIKSRARKFLIQTRSFAELLENSIRKYRNRAIETAAVIEELIQLAREMREAGKRGEDLGLTEDELAFYDALETNDSAVKVLGEPTLKSIAQELVQTIRKNVTIDWTERESVRARLRVMVKRILRKHGYPPDKQEKATKTVLEQAELLCHDWAA